MLDDDFWEFVFRIFFCRFVSAEIIYIYHYNGSDA
jgi:hypothetical protein